MTLFCVCVLSGRIFEMPSEDGDKVTEFGDDRVFNDLRYTINSDKLHALGWREVRRGKRGAPPQAGRQGRQGALVVC